MSAGRKSRKEKHAVPSLSIKPAELTASQLQEFIKNGGNVDMKIRGSPLMCELSRANKADSVALLIQNGAKVNCQNRSNSTPLYIAASHGHCSVIACLLSAGADMEISNQSGSTPLVSALKNRQVKAAEALIEAGACVNAGVSFNASSQQCEWSLVDLVLDRLRDLELAKSIVKAGAYGDCYGDMGVIFGLYNEVKIQLPISLLLQEEKLVEFVRYLHAAGWRFSPVWIDMIQDLEHLFNALDPEHMNEAPRQHVRQLTAALNEGPNRSPTCFSLQHFARLRIRQVMSQCFHPGVNLSKRINRLPLPDGIKKYIDLDIL